MSPAPVDSSTRKRKISENSDITSLASNESDSTPKRSRLSDAKDSIFRVFGWISDKTKRALTRETLVQPISYVHKVWDDLSQSFGQGYEYQGPELEGPEMITSVPTLVPMSNVSMTASSGMPSTNLATNTTFMNLAPQPSLPSLGASSNIHSGNANINHPLQSLHAMHPGGTDILNSEVSSQEAAAAVAFVVHQQQQFNQLSLNRASAAAESGKFPRGSNGFAPSGFSTPLVSVSAPQSRLGNRSAFPLGIGGGHNMTTFSTSKTIKSQERAPIRLRCTKLNSTHEKIFSPRPKTTLRPISRSDSPAVPNVFRHLLKKVRKKPTTVKQSINLEEKKMYLELLRANGIRLPGDFSKTSDPTTVAERSRSSSVVTLDSKSSGFSGSPPIAASPTSNSRKASAISGSKQKPISLGEDDDESDDPVFVGRVASPVLAERRVEEVVLDDETPSVSSADATSVSDVDDKVKQKSDDSNEKEIDFKAVEEIGVVLLESSSKASTPLATPKPISSLGKSAFFVEKEIPGTKTVDLTGEAEKVVTTAGQYERKPSVRKVSVPAEPEFMKSVRQSPYSDPKWIANMKHGIMVDKSKNAISAKEQEAHLTVLQEERNAQDQDLVTRLRNNLTVSRRLKPEVEEVFVESSEESEEEEEEEEEDKAFPVLTDEMNDKVDAATNPGPAMEVLSSAFKLDITRKDIRTLVGLEWLNDEIINFYMNMLVDRSEKSEGNLPKVYTFNTFFYPTLIKDGYSRLKRWTRKIDLFSHDMIIIPVHLQMHWCLAVIDLAKKEIRYYDSMGGDNKKCLNALKSYLEEEHKDKKNGPINLDDWRYECVKDIPQQMNGSDCGMFTCKFAEYNTRRAPINFTQQHMPYFRRRMIYEILSLQLM